MNTLLIGLLIYASLALAATSSTVITENGLAINIIISNDPSIPVTLSVDPGLQVTDSKSEIGDTAPVMSTTSLTASPSTYSGPDTTLFQTSMITVSSTTSTASGISTMVQDPSISASSLTPASLGSSTTLSSFNADTVSTSISTTMPLLSSTISIDLPSSVIVPTFSPSMEAMDEGRRFPKVHRVNVGANSSFTFHPSQVAADVGDVLTFNFASYNHTVRESSVDLPCSPLFGGFNTGFHQYNPTDRGNLSVSITVNSLDPRFFYCEQPYPVPHCELGMVFALNAGPLFDSFVSNDLQVGPLSAVATSLSELTVTATNERGTMTTTFANLTLPKYLLNTTVPALTTVILPTVQGPTATPDYSNSLIPRAIMATETSDAPLAKTISLPLLAYIVSFFFVAFYILGFRS